MTNSEETSTRPVSVAELLAKNGTIGSPPAGGRRRRRRGNADAVTVAELTGEIPVIRTGSFPVVTEQDLRDAEAAEQAKKPATEPAAEPAETAPADPAGDTQTAEEAAEAEAAAERRAEELKQAREAREAEQARRRAAEAKRAAARQAGREAATKTAEAPAKPTPAPATPAPAELTPEAAGLAELPPQRSSRPAPRRGRSPGPERSPDPRPVRRSSRGPVLGRGPARATEDVDDAASAAEDLEAAEAMSPDLVDDAESVAIIDLELEAEADDALFGGDSVADELARRRVAAEVAAVAEAAEDDGDDDGEPEPVALRSAPATGGGGHRLMYGAAIALQSVVAVAFGAGLFLAFDRLWQWNSIIALVLSVLVILGLVIGVRVVRKTEDIASTLIAVAVGALVTLGPLAMLQSV